MSQQIFRVLENIRIREIVALAKVFVVKQAKRSFSDIASGKAALAILALPLATEMLFPSSIASAMLRVQEALAANQAAAIGTLKAGPRLEYALTNQGDQASQARKAAYESLEEKTEHSIPTDATPRRVIRVPMTAYNSLPEQTDGSPFVTATNTHVRHGVVAANFLPKGTKIKIPDYYGDQVFIVEDGMNTRYWERIDIWMANKSDAKAWGLRNVMVEIY